MEAAHEQARRRRAAHARADLIARHHSGNYVATHEAIVSLGKGDRYGQRERVAMYDRFLVDVIELKRMPRCAVDQHGL